LFRAFRRFLRQIDDIGAIVAATLRWTRDGLELSMNEAYQRMRVELCREQRVNIFAKGLNNIA